MTQAVAWHELNDVSWSKLAAMKDGASSRFRRDELKVAKRLVDLDDTALLIESVGQSSPQLRR